MLELREFHFQLAFMAARALRKDVEDQARAIQHPPLDEFFEIAFLRWRQRMIEQHQLGAVLMRDRADLVGLAAAHEVARIGTIAASTDTCNRNRARGACQLLEFLDVFGIRGCTQSEAHQHGPFTCAGSLEHC